MSPDSGTDAATLGELVTACSRVIEYTRGLSRTDLDGNHQLLSACCYQTAVTGGYEASGGNESCPRSWAALTYS